MQSLLGTHRNRLLVLGYLLLGTAIAGTPLYAEGWFLSHDIAPHLQRIFAVSHEMRLGDYYPRWLSLALYGKGLPDLNFYSPAYYLLVSWLHVAGIPLALVLKTVCFVLSLVGAWGVYLWMRRYSCTSGALLSATLFLFLPYRFLDIYVRGAVPEFAALSLLPWLFYALDLSFSQEGRRHGIGLTALISAALVLTHHLSALMIMPFAAIYFVWHSYACRKEPRAILWSALGPAAGAGLSAFYWLPVVFEMKYLSYFENPVNVWDHFVSPFQWFISTWGFGLSVPGPDDGMSFQIGPALLGVVAAGGCTITWLPPQLRRSGLLLLILGTFGLFMTTEYASVLYEVVYPLRLIQFPWRFLGPATLFLVAFAGFLSANSLFLRRSWARWGLFALILAVSVSLSSEHRAVRLQEAIDLDALEAETVRLNQVGGRGVALEFLPKWATFDPNGFVNSPLWIAPRHYAERISELAVKGSRMQFRIDAESQAHIIIPWYYFPGWRAQAGDVSIPVVPDANGFVSFALPPGAYQVSVWFGSTWPRITGWIVAAVTMLAFLVGGVYRQRVMRDTP